jgi:hypothetical protein
MSANKFILGDKIEILKTMEGETVDLIYRDPPFFGKRKRAVPYLEMVDGEIILTQEGVERIILITNKLYSFLKEAFPDAPVWKRFFDNRGSIFKANTPDTTKLDFSGSVGISEKTYFEKKRTYPLTLLFGVKAREFEDGECGICNYIGNLGVSENARGKGYARKVLDTFDCLYKEKLIEHLNFKDASEGFWDKMLPRYPFLNNLWKNGWELDIDKDRMPIKNIA